MKRLIVILLTVCVMLTQISCSRINPHVDPPMAEQPEITPTSAPSPVPTLPAENGQVIMNDLELPSEPLEIKVAIVTNTLIVNDDELRIVEILQTKYGTDKVVHRTRPVGYAREVDIIAILQEIAEDPDVNILIINPARSDTNAAVDRFLELRDDVFIVYIQPTEDPSDVAVRANLVIDTNNAGIGTTIAMQAKALGADTIVHYSFARHMSVPLYAMRRVDMRSTAEREGLRFVEFIAPDPMGDGGSSSTESYIIEDVPRQVETFGVNTAFFGTSCAMQLELIRKVVETGAIFPQVCCLRYIHVIPHALGISDWIPTGEYNRFGSEIMGNRPFPEVIEESRRELATRGATGRLSTWPAPDRWIWTAVGAEYAIKWLNGEVDKYTIDLDVFAELCIAYSMEMVGEPIGVDLEFLMVEGRTYPNFVMALMHYLTF